MPLLMKKSALYYNHDLVKGMDGANQLNGLYTKTVPGGLRYVTTDNHGGLIDNVLTDGDMVQLGKQTLSYQKGKIKVTSDEGGSVYISGSDICMSGVRTQASKDHVIYSFGNKGGVSGANESDETLPEHNSRKLTPAQKGFASLVLGTEIKSIDDMIRYGRETCTDQEEKPQEPERNQDDFIRVQPQKQVPFYVRALSSVRDVLNKYLSKYDKK